jgi:hypothetical protein
LHLVAYTLGGEVFDLLGEAKGGGTRGAGAGAAYYKRAQKHCTGCGEPTSGDRGALWGEKLH